MLRYISISIMTIVFAGFAYANTDTQAPKPTASPISSGYNDLIRSLQLPPDLSAKLLDIQDPKIRQSIASAAKGGCPSTFTFKGTDAKVEHAKQCGRTAEEKKKRNGKACFPQGVVGAKVEAMCVQGCCVALDVKPDRGFRIYYNEDGSLVVIPNELQQNSSGFQLSPQDSRAISGMIGQFFGRMFSSSNSSSGESGYNPWYYYRDYNYESVLGDGNSVTKTEPSYDTDQDTTNIVDDSDHTLNEAGSNDISVTDDVADYSTPAQDNILPKDSVVTVISSNGKKIQVKTDQQKDKRYTFVNRDTNPDIVYISDSVSNGNVEENNLKNEIILNEQRAAQGIDSETLPDEAQDPASTGFKGEKIGIIEQESLLTKIARWVRSLFGF